MAAGPSERSQIVTSNASTSFVQRWWTYQQERFPLLAHGPLIAAFSFCAVSYSAHLRTGIAVMPSWPVLLVAFLSCLLFFAQLRIADEFKDFEEDSRYRPYRAVPRGLVSLRSLGLIFSFAAVTQLLLALLLNPAMILLLLIPWVYLFAMCYEFGAREWLKARPITYLWTHMLIIPLVDLYATGCDWLAASHSAPQGLVWFLLASFFNGIVIELGRKLRAPRDEEEGVVTYTVLWGTIRAPLVWLTMMLLTGLIALQAAALTQTVDLVIWPLATLWIFSAVVTLQSIRRADQLRGFLFERLSGLWTLGLYLGLGALPLVIHPLS